MKILVTGAGGFIGGALVKGLRQTGEHEVIGLYLTLPLAVPGVRWIQCDLSKTVPLDEDIDYIIHCAAVQNVQDMTVRDFIDANLLMTENIAHYGKSAGVKGLIFTSSISLHGEVRGDLVDEKTDRINPTLYGLTKYLCERVLQEYQEFLPSVALRLCGVVGPGAKNVWLAGVLADALRGSAISIVNADRPFNNILHTDDLLSFMLSLMRNGFSGFNAFPIASGSSLPVRDVVCEIIKELNSSSAITDNGVTGNSFMISNSFAMTRFHYVPSDVAMNVKKFAREMS